MPAKPLKILITFSCSLLLTSCITVGVFPLVEKLDKSNDDCQLDLYWIKEQVKAPKVDLCEITAAVPHYPWRDHVLGEAFDQAYPQACRCGGDGIYIHELGKGVLKVTAFRYNPKPDSLKSSQDQSEFKSRLLCLEQGKNAYWENGFCNVAKTEQRPLNMRQRAQ
ncbi:MAG: hypothetical protein HRU09_10895 [Oligoflexales bacterium]|nr:hypothetical protein [Oligoflexales bacterium]